MSLGTAILISFCEISAQIAPSNHRWYASGLNNSCKCPETAFQIVWSAVLGVTIAAVVDSLVGFDFVSCIGVASARVVFVPHFLAVNFHSRCGVEIDTHSFILLGKLFKI